MLIDWLKIEPSNALVKDVTLLVSQLEISLSNFEKANIEVISFALVIFHEFNEWLYIPL